MFLLHWPCVTGCSLHSLCPPALRTVPRPPAVLPAALQRLLQERHHHGGAALRPQQLLVWNYLLAPRGASRWNCLTALPLFPWAEPSSSGSKMMDCTRWFAGFLQQHPPPPPCWRACSEIPYFLTANRRYSLRDLDSCLLIQAHVSCDVLIIAQG